MGSLMPSDREKLRGLDLAEDKRTEHFAVLRRNHLDHHANSILAYEEITATTIVELEAFVAVEDIRVGLRANLAKEFFDTPRIACRPAWVLASRAPS